MKGVKTREEYVKKYYELYDDGSKFEEFGIEIEAVGKFIFENVSGIFLDVGCGPVPQMWSVFMPKAKEIYAVDLPMESIVFIKNKLKKKKDWYKNFLPYQFFIEKLLNKKLGEFYILEQIDKIKFVEQADMTKDLPFSDNFFDTVASFYSMGTLKSEQELNKAIFNINRILKIGGKFIHINTNGANKNDILPEYTWQGLPQGQEIVEHYLKKNGFKIIKKQKIKLDDDGGEYKFNEINMFLAEKNCSL